MTDAQGNQLTYRQVAERMTLRSWTGGDAAPGQAGQLGSEDQPPHSSVVR
jgi:hypothetical protein